MNLGWSAYLTTFSKETNRRSDGSAKIDLNQTEAKKLYEDLESALGAEWATFIVAWRQGSEVSKTDTSPGQPVAGCEPNLDLPLSRSLTTVLDLVGPRVRARIKGKDQPVILETPFPDAPIASGVFLPKLLDNCTVGSSAPTGRVNINVASRTVLAAVLRADPTLSADTSKVEEMVDQIVSLRPQDPSQLDDEYKYETWLYTKMVVELDQMKKLMPYVCAQGCVYRTRAVGYFDRGGPAARIEVVIDATNSPPRILFWRDMTHLGRGYPLETLGIEVSEPSAGMNTGY
jgi:hypothetical protein